MKLIFFGDYLKKIYKAIIIIIILLLMILKVSFLFSNSFDYRESVLSIYASSLDGSEKSEEKEELSPFYKMWLDIKEFYMCGF